MADNYIERQYEAYQARKAAWEKERKYKKKNRRLRLRLPIARELSCKIR